MSPHIKLDHVNFFYGKGTSAEVQALKDIDIEIQQGQYVSFFGPSGCGKSTLLYLISGMDNPTEGHVIVNGRDLSQISPAEIAVYRQVGIGIIFQNFNLIPTLRNIDNVSLPMSFLGISPTKRRKRALEIFDRLGIMPLAERFPYELSGGQQQRIGIARAIANDPPIILADEPIGNLDSTNATILLDWLKEINQKDGKTIIMVTHEAWSLRDVQKNYFLKDGQIIKVEEKTPVPEVHETQTSYYAKELFPDLPQIELHIKAFAPLILRGYAAEQIARLEKLFLARYNGELSADRLIEELDKPYKDGGVGLWRPKALKVAKYVEEFMREEENLQSLYRKLEENPEAPLYVEVENISEWLLGDTKANLSPLQTASLAEAIDDRVRRIITPDHFRRVLNLPKKDGGVGLLIGTSLKLSEKLESLLSGSIGDVAQTA